MAALKDIVLDMQPFSIITLAAHFGRGYFVKALLRIMPGDTAHRYLSSGSARGAIHKAIERRSLDAVRTLLEYGADLLYQLNDNRNALHCAAQYYPSILPELIEFVENLTEEKRNHQSMKQILDKVDKNGHTVFGLLLTEGYEDEQRLAETLRIKYDLMYDFAFQHEDGSCETFAGSLVTITAGSGMVSPTHVQYLLRLTPPPSFICTLSGETLLTQAVQGPLSHRDEHDLPGHRLVSMILETYPQSALILLGKPYSALHRAAQYANRVALDMFIDHIEASHPDKPLPLSRCAADGNTVLDCAAIAVAQPSRQRENPDELDNIASRQLQRAAVGCYEFLRGKGALHKWELKGNLHTARLIYWRVDWDKLADFIEETTVNLGLGPSDCDLDDIVELSPSNPNSPPRRRLPVVELAWRFDNFIIRAYSVRITAVAHEAWDLFTHYVRETRMEENIRNYTLMELAAGDFPFKAMTYTHTIPSTNIKATWTRTGRVWTVEETIDLRARFSQEWDRHFGETEDEVLASLTERMEGNSPVVAEITQRSNNEDRRRRHCVVM
ncbi:hypothetical protein BDW72DRAFT_186992 [Aspergillus terricola var. indicus]